MLPAPASKERSRDVLLLESNQVLKCLRISRELGSQSARASATPGLSPGWQTTARQPGGLAASSPARRNELLPAPRRPDERLEMRCRQLLPHRLDLGFAAEEVLRILFGEGGETRVGSDVVGPGGPKRSLFQCPGQSSGALVAALGLPGDRLC